MEKKSDPVSGIKSIRKTGRNVLLVRLTWPVVFLALGAKVYHSDHPNLLGAKRSFSGAEVSSTVDT
jgi:hypothetical protein